MNVWSLKRSTILWTNSRNSYRNSNTPTRDAWSRWCCMAPARRCSSRSTEPRFSDLNVLCVLQGDHAARAVRRRAGPELVAADGHPAPLLLTEVEVSRSADCFPIEFRDMKERRRVLYRSRSDRRAAHRHALLSRADRVPVADQATAPAPAGRQRAVRSGRAAAVVRGFGHHLLHVGTARARRGRAEAQERPARPWCIS